jgi:hypothetical protein
MLKIIARASRNIILSIDNFLCGPATHRHPDESEIFLRNQNTKTDEMKSCTHLFRFACICFAFQVVDHA